MVLASCAALGSLLAAACDGDNPPADAVPAPLGEFVVMTFNTGIPDCSRAAGAEYSCEDAAIAAEWYGTGLAFERLVSEARAFTAAVQPDIVAFQEIFHSEGCAEIPAAYHPGFVCENWQPGSATVAQQVLGGDYQIACNLDKPDKCLAVKTSFGGWRDCAASLCLDHLDGARVDGCGGGSRVGRGVIELRGGGEITVVNVHGTSGITAADADCRRRQFEQVFVDLGDGSGEPAANGSRNLVLGDLNTDPGRNLWDPSAAAWNTYAGDGKAFRFHSAVGLLAEPTYARLFNIDHVVSDVFAGDCVSGEVTDIASFDHVPIICTLALP